MSRKIAREIVMKLLYQIDITGEYDEGSLNELKKESPLDERDTDYINDLIAGVSREKNEIDQYISQYAKGWSIQRMAKVDLAILRLALYEILYRNDIPVSVSINEGVELAKKYGNEKSGSFINGILGNFVRTSAVKCEDGETKEE